MRLYRLLRPLAVAVACLLPLAAAADEVQDKVAACTAPGTKADRRVAACTWLLASNKVPQQRARIYYSLGRGYADQGRHDQAVKIYSKLIEGQPPQSRAHFELRWRRGDSYRLQGDHGRALDDYNWLLERIPQEHPQHAEVRLRRADSAGRYGLLDHAIADYSWLLERIPQDNPQHAQLRLRRASSYGRQGKHDAAIADYSWLLERNPQDTRVRGQRGVEYAKNGQPDRAIVDYDTAIRQLRDAGQAVRDTLYINRANAYRRKRDFDRAIADCDRAIAVSASARNYTERAWMSYLAGRYAKAATDVERALDLDPLYADAAETKAKLLVVRGQPAQAVLQFERAMLLGGRAKIRAYDKALRGHGYDLGKAAVANSYVGKMNKALVACVQAGCRLID